MSPGEEGWHERTPADDIVDGLNRSGPFDPSPAAIARRIFEAMAPGCILGNLYKLEPRPPVDPKIEEFARASMPPVVGYRVLAEQCCNAARAISETIREKFDSNAP